MTVVDFIRRHQPSPHARGEGILAAKRYREKHVPLMCERVLADLDDDIERALKEALEVDTGLAAHLGMVD